MKILCLVLAIICMLPISAQVIDVKMTEDYSPYIFGHNLEHTRAAVNGGLSAQMLKNRKFAGKPQPNMGISSKWFPIGERVFFFKNASTVYTKHICLPNMRRMNERRAQVIQNLYDGQLAGMGQYDLALVGGKSYELRTVTRVNAPVCLKVELTNRAGTKVYATHSLSLVASDDWCIHEFDLISSESDKDAVIRYVFTEKAEVIIGALSMMPKDHFHGMRSDVVAHLKAIKPTLIRWPGGNFAGEYRWKDGLLPVDQRAPLQAYTEIETQPFTDGLDYHEINTDDFIALCREVGATPLLTINLAWNTPEESAQWVEYCNGSADTEYGKIRAERGHQEPYNVHFWSLGNEMGYGHMEGPNGTDGYTKFALRHADAMLKVTPDLELFASGPYPNDKWAKESAALMADKVKYISLHHYTAPKGERHFTTPEDIKKTYEGTVDNVFSHQKNAEDMRKCLDGTGKKLHISYDEWNQWYSWYRPSYVGEGLYTARMLHYFLNHSNRMDIPVACYFQPVGEGAILIEPTESRLTANGQMFAMMAEHQGGKLCKVTENEDLSTTATLKDDVLTVTLINESYDKDREFCFDLRGKLVDAYVYTADDLLPYSYFNRVPLEVMVGKKQVKTVLPPHSAAIIHLKVKK